MRSQGKMHFSWNRWLHGSFRTSVSVSLNSSKQTEHCVLLVVCSSVITIFGISDNLVWLIGGGRGELKNELMRSSRSKWNARLGNPRSTRRAVDEAAASPSPRPIALNTKDIRGERLRLRALLAALCALLDLLVAGEMSDIILWIMENKGSALVSRSAGRLLVSLTSSMNPSRHCGHEKST